MHWSGHVNPCLMRQRWQRSKRRRTTLVRWKQNSDFGKQLMRKHSVIALPWGWDSWSTTVIYSVLYLSPSGVKKLARSGAVAGISSCQGWAFWFVLRKAIWKLQYCEVMINFEINERCCGRQCGRTRIWLTIKAWWKTRSFMYRIYIPTRNSLKISAPSKVVYP